MRNYLPQGTKYTKLQLNNVLNDVPGKAIPQMPGFRDEKNRISTCLWRSFIFPQ